MPPSAGDPADPEVFEDFQRRRASQRRRFYAQRPKRIDNVLAQVVQRKGYAQLRAAGEREEAWQAAVGEVASQTRLGSFRRGVLEVLVANSLLLQELTFRKEDLLKKLQQALPDTGVRQIKFRVGAIP